MLPAVWGVSGRLGTCPLRTRAVTVLFLSSKISIYFFFVSFIFLLDFLSFQSRVFAIVGQSIVFNSYFESCQNTLMSATSTWVLAPVNPFS